MKKIYLSLCVVLCMGCQSENKKNDDQFGIQLSHIIVRDLLDGYKHETFAALPVEASETVYTIKNDGNVRDTVHYIFHIKDSLLQLVQVSDGTMNYVNSYQYDAQKRVATMESKDVNGQQYRKFIIEYNQDGLLKRYTDYVSGEIDEIYSYQLSPSGDVMVGTSNYGSYDKYKVGIYRDSLFRVHESSYTPENIALYGGIRIFDNHNRMVERYANAKNLEKKYIYTYDRYNNLIANLPNEAQSDTTSIDEFGSIVPTNPVHRFRYNYKYDPKGNWIERLSFCDDVLYSKSVRVFKY